MARLAGKPRNPSSHSNRGLSYFAKVSLILLAITGFFALPMGASSASQPSQSQYVFPSSGSNTYRIGAQVQSAICSPICSYLNNTGARTTVQVVSEPVVGCLSYWVSDDSAANIWGQVGYYICNSSTPVAFYQIWNLDSYSILTTGTTTVSTGYHTFSMYSQPGGNTWAYSLDGSVFGTYDMGSSISKGTYPAQAVSEEGYVSGPWNPAQVTFTTAIETYQTSNTFPSGNGWYTPPSAYELGGGCSSSGAVNASGGYSCWGIAGNLQDSSIPIDSMVTGGTTPLLAAASYLWLPSTPDFSVSANPTSLTSKIGTPASSTLTIAPLNGFTGTVNLSTSISPSTSLTCTLTPTSVTTSGTSALTCTGSATGGFTITVTGRSGSLSHAATITFSVTDFTITASPATVGADAGSPSASTVTVAPVNGFTGAISLAFSVSPSTGLTCTLSPNGISLGPSQNSTLSCTGISMGTFTVTVTGTNGSLSHNATVTYSIQDFAMSVSPSSISIPTNVAGNSTITIAPINGFSGKVDLTLTVSSLSLNCILSPTSVTLGATQTSTLSCTSADPGTFSVTVVGTSGSLNRTTTVGYNVGGVQDFSLTVNPTSIEVVSGTFASSTITVASVNSFTGTVQLSFSISQGLACTINPTSLILGVSQNSTLTCGGSAGLYTVTVTGTSGSIFHSSAVSVTVTDYTMSASSTTLNFNAGEIGITTIAISPVNSFTGTISLDVVISPSSGLACTPVPLIMIMGGPQTSTVSCAGSEGSYTATITGTSMGIAHSLTISITVMDFAMTANPTAVTVPPRNTGNSTITLNRNGGFNGNVSLTVSIFPATGLNCSLSQSTISGGSGSSTLSCSGLKGNYNVVVTGTSGSLVHSTTVAFHQAGKYLLEVVVPSQGVSVTIDGVTLTADASGKIVQDVDPGNHTISVQSTLPYTLWSFNVPSGIATNTFGHWSDGSTRNPLVLTIANDTSLTAAYDTSVQTSSYAIGTGIFVLGLISTAAIIHRKKKNSFKIESI
jgi:hypothetical protein